MLPARRLRIAVAVGISLFSFTARAADLVVFLPQGETVTTGNAIERGSAVIKPATADGAEAKFSDLLPSAIYDLAIEAKSGSLRCGADLSWCDSTPTDPQAEALGDDDRESIRAIVQDIRGFANKPSIVMTVGNHDRAVALIDLVRDSGFHSNEGGEVIWRVEVWFFEWENGAWARVPNQSRVLRRERFASKVEYQREVGRVRWDPGLGGIRLAAGARVTEIHLNPPTTRASDSAAGLLPTAPADVPARR